MDAWTSVENRSLDEQPIGRAARFVIPQPAEPSLSMVCWVGCLTSAEPWVRRACSWGAIAARLIAKSRRHSARNASAGALQQVVEEFMRLFAADLMSPRGRVLRRRPTVRCGEQSKASAARAGSWVGFSRRPSKSASNSRSAWVPLRSANLRPSSRLPEHSRSNSEAYLAMASKLVRDQARSVRSSICSTAVESSGMSSVGVSAM